MIKKITFGLDNFQIVIRHEAAVFKIFNKFFMEFQRKINVGIRNVRDFIFIYPNFKVDRKNTFFLFFFFFFTRIESISFVSDFL